MRWIRMMVLMLWLAGCAVPGTLAPTPLPGESTATPPPIANRPTPTSVQPVPTPPQATVPPPTVTPEPPTATPAPPVDDQAAALRAVAEATPRDALTVAQAFSLVEGSPTLASRPAPAVGQRETFWATNVVDNSHFQITATLRVQSPHLLLYLEDGRDFTDRQLQDAAASFEADVWPVLARLFGSAAALEMPITVLNARIPGVGGYYAVDNELPRALNRFSNERPMIFVNTDSRPPGSPGFVGVLAHEVQHLLHRRTLTHPAIWFNEGGSMLVEHLTGYGDNGLVASYLLDPDVQLNGWSELGGSSNSHYGASELFLRYLDDQLKQQGGLPLGQLASADAGDQAEALLKLIQQRFPDLQSFGDLYATWATANLVSDPTLADGRYGYAGLPRAVEPLDALADGDAGLVHQLGSDYLRWEPAASERTIVFTGDTTVPLIPTTVAEGNQVWWSGRGDTRLSTLTSAVQVPAADATLSYRIWFEIEADYDYAYLTVSTDGGKTWQPTPIPSSSSADPLGLNLGHGITGKSGDWRTEQVDLSAWSGQQIQLRFWLVNDEAFNAAGLALDDLHITGVSALSWQGAGFVEIINRLPQDWELRGVLASDNSAQSPTVVDIPVGAGRAEWTIPANTRGTLIISGASPATTEQAQYEYARK